MGKILQTLNPNIPKPITDVLNAIVEAETGLAKNLGIPAAPFLGNFAQRTISYGMKVATQEAIEDLRKDGRISNEYLSSAQAQYTLAQLLDFFDGEIPYQNKFEVLKNILLRAATEEVSTKEDIRPQQYMQVMKDLPAGAILIMTKCYEITHKDMPPINGDGTLRTDEWRNILAKETGLLSYDLVCNYEEILEKKRLIAAPLGMEKVYVPVRPAFRLTDLGFEIMKFVELS